MKMEWHGLKQLICTFLCAEQKPFIFSPDSILPIRGNTLRTILKETYPDAHIRIADGPYNIISYRELKRWLNTDSLDKMRYIKDIWDCDDFARESRCRMLRLNRRYQKNFMYAYCEGYTPIGYHAFNLSFCGGNIKIIEPQNDDTGGWHRSDYKLDFIQL